MKHRIIIPVLLAAMSLAACNSLEIEPRNVITESAVFSSVAGVEAYLIDCYNHNYVEDFTHDGVRYGWCTIAVSGAYCGETVDEEWWSDGKYVNPGSGVFSFWNYNYVREVNYFIDVIDKYAEQYGYAQNLVDQWKGEAYFILANHYFNMAKRHGGLPIVDHVISQDLPVEDMCVARSSEYDTYKFICDNFKKAAELLKSNTGYTKARASKAAAYGMLSRAALYAGTIAKYNDLYTPYSQMGGLQGIDKSKAEEFLKLAYDAACEAEKIPGYALESDYYQMFTTTTGYNNSEYIMIKEWKHVSSEDCNSFATNSAPRSTENYTGYDIPGFNCPTFDFVSLYEDANGGPGSRGFASRMYKNGKDETDGLIAYNNPADFFVGKDPRMAQTCIIPFSKFYGDDIIIRKGLIKSDGTYVDETTENALRDAMADGYVVNSFPGYDEKFTVSRVYNPSTDTKMDKFSQWGAAVASVDGVHPYGTPSGFYTRKFQDESVDHSTLTQRNNETPFPIIRLAEIYLNKAEAAVELGGSYVDAGLEAINKIRDRAGIKKLQTSEFTVENVRLEREIELAIEQHTYWDRKRWRQMHTYWDNRVMKALWPYLDYSNNQYVFKEGTARANMFDGNYDIKWYYESIPSGEISKNPSLLQNYGY